MDPRDKPEDDNVQSSFDMVVAGWIAVWVPASAGMTGGGFDAGAAT